jgi:hypothetical protein
MRRFVVVFFCVLGWLTAAGLPIQAKDIRYPQNGIKAFVISLSPGWDTKEDTVNGGIQVFPNEHWGAVYLTMTQDQQYAGRPLKELATAIGAVAGISDITKQEPAVVSGMKGEAFYGQLKNPKGLVLDAKMVLIPLAADLWATKTILSIQNLTAARRAELVQAVKAITLTTDK